MWGKRDDMIIHDEEPFNAEPPSAALAGRPGTPIEASNSRNRGPSPDPDPATWRQRIDIQPGPSESYFQAEGYRLLPPDAEPGPGRGISLGPLTMTSGILCPDDDRVPAGVTDVIGYAFAAEGRTIVRVDVSVDGGRTWIQAVVDDPPSSWAWQLWHTTLDLPAGPAEITARAWDDIGATQPEFPASLWNPAGYDNNSWARIRVDVG